MITPSHKVRIFVASDPVDFRKGHDGLAALVQGHLRQKPFDGSVYVFRAKRADRLKLIYWDGSGLVMAYKRLEDNSFKWPAIKNGVMRLEPAQFEALFAGLDWRRVQPLEVAAPSAAE
ncbi:IS66 family insertion sequence element accessory protein TnpB [uncultured Roseovarius sp.]|uniref:IS66 family insertion sequence element accessory protein TnpB n=1 Tax=uncultured Roseovarius sp. TaxID=293344 RepID=UPI00262BD7DD|nr:IS66 family insertion sequence element accessory protein TnpB [uncultured Roseovarius sp.]